MLRCRGFRRDAFLDDHAGSVASPSMVLDDGWPEAPRAIRRYPGSRSSRNPHPTREPMLGFSVLPLAGGRVAGYRRDKRSPATTR